MLEWRWVGSSATWFEPPGQSGDAMANRTRNGPGKTSGGNPWYDETRRTMMMMIHSVDPTPRDEHEMPFPLGSRMVALVVVVGRPLMLLLLLLLVWCWNSQGGCYYFVLVDSRRRGWERLPPRFRGVIESVVGGFRVVCCCGCGSPWPWDRSCHFRRRRLRLVVEEWPCRRRCGSHPTDAVVVVLAVAVAFLVVPIPMHDDVFDDHTC